MPCGRDLSPTPGEERSLLENALRCFAKVSRNRLVHLANQAVVVRMAMRENEPDDGAVALLEPVHSGEQQVVTDPSIERQTDVEDQACTLVLEFNAAAANLIGASVNTNPHTSDGLPQR